MRPTFFNMKRATCLPPPPTRHLRAHKPLTPARIDLLTVIAAQPNQVIRQSELVRKLGLHHSTVSKMLKRMFELDLVDRDIDEDGRCGIVYITDLAKKLLADLATGPTASYVLDFLVECGLAPRRYGRDPWPSPEVRRMNTALRRYTYLLYDTSIDLYAANPVQAAA